MKDEKQAGDKSCDVSIQPLNGQVEATACATMVVNSEPWITLRTEFKATLDSINDPTREVYIAHAGEAVAGFVMVNMGGAISGYIQMLIVAPEWRNRGIGEQLLRFAEQRILRDSPNVFLCVTDFNSRAQQFYARMGYERVGELKDYVITGASEFLMRKTTGPKRGFQKQN